MILLTVVGIREDALRGALKVAHNAKRMAGASRIRARAQAHITIVSVGHITRFDGYIHPAIRVLYTGGEQLTRLTNGSRCLSSLAAARFPGLKDAGGNRGSAHQIDDVEQ